MSGCHVTMWLILDSNAYSHSARWTHQTSGHLVHSIFENHRLVVLECFSPVDRSKPLIIWLNQPICSYNVSGFEVIIFPVCCRLSYNPPFLFFFPSQGWVPPASPPTTPHNASGYEKHRAAALMSPDHPLQHPQWAGMRHQYQPGQHHPPARKPQWVFTVWYWIYILSRWLNKDISGVPFFFFKAPKKREKSSPVVCASHFFFFISQLHIQRQ